MPRPTKVGEWLQNIWAKVRRHAPPVGLGILVIFSVAGTVYNLVLVRRDIIQPAPIRYLARPERVETPLCPGDMILYSFRFEIDDEVLPVALTIDRGIFSLDLGRFVVGSQEPVTYPYNRPAVISRTSAYPIPLDMDDGQPFPPGSYTLSVTGESELRKTVGFEIPFTIGNNCPALSSSHD